MREWHKTMCRTFAKLYQTFVSHTNQYSRYFFNTWGDRYTNVLHAVQDKACRFLDMGDDPETVTAQV